MPRARLHAPSEHRGVLAVPPLGEARKLLQANQSRLSENSVHILDRPLPDLRRLAKSEARAAAEAHLLALGLPTPATASDQWIVTGHQPELFHPGVWVKNFAAFGLAQRLGGTSLQLIIDNDTVKSTAIRVPLLASNPMRAVSVSFDAWNAPVPWEELTVADEARLVAFPAEVSSHLVGASFEPLLPEFWKDVTALQTPLLGKRLAGGRRRLEERCGCRNLELPLSELCKGETFAWFAGHLLAQLPRFHAVHNAGLLQHRRTRGIRSRNHPVPELATDGEWLEAPFWVWRTDDPDRRRVFARERPGALDIRLRSNVWAEIPCDRGAESTVAGLRELEAHGYKLRPRALTTTMFARLFLADLFIHGIGGAIYDELTDQIIRTFFGIEPPAFLTLSATLHLPLIPWRGAADNLRRVRKRMRDLEWNPQRYLPTLDNPVRDLIREKQRLIDWMPTTAAERNRRYHEIRRVTAQLNPQVRREQSILGTTAARLAQLTETEAVARDRTYAFCLYPEVELREFVSQFL
jgi:hypothetical protein